MLPFWLRIHFLVENHKKCVKNVHTVENGFSAALCARKAAAKYFTVTYLLKAVIKTSATGPNSSQEHFRCLYQFSFRTSNHVILFNQTTLFHMQIYKHKS